MYIRRNAAVKYCLALVFGTVLYAEFLVYYIQPLFWLNLQCKDVEGCTKILFIADPQIQGETAVPPPLSYLFNWDSDRYLRMTFTRVAHYLRPDVMVFLGDLMDEGSIANEDQYGHYILRLSDIFEQVPYPLHKVWIPGDNDIGGENEPIKWDKVKTFHRVFSQPPVMAFKGISFYRINAITNAYPKLNGNWTDDNFKIAVSHYPLMMRHAIFKEVSKRVDPDIYFCAHDHESKYTSQKKSFEGPLQRNKMHQFYGREILEIKFDTNEVFEIYVPTCSYRMGTSRIGYGAAVVDRTDADTNNSNIKLRYTVFWSSQRFPYLFVYAGLLVLGLVYTTAYVFKLCFKYYCQSVSKLPVYRRLNTSPNKL